jgi:hypothetical protein
MGLYVLNRVIKEVFIFYRVCCVAKMADQKMEIRLDKCEEACRGGMFDSNKSRDQVILLTFGLVAAYILYMWYMGMQMSPKASLDNRPRPF